mgnify:CR=1 FL=1
MFEYDQYATTYRYFSINFKIDATFFSFVKSDLLGFVEIIKFELVVDSINFVNYKVGLTAVLDVWHPAESYPSKIFYCGRFHHFL